MNHASVLRRCSQQGGKHQTQWHGVRIVAILLVFAGISGKLDSVRAANLYVSPSGDDSGDGTQESPLATIAAARDRARVYAGKESVTVHLADGAYYLPETLVFEPQDSGSAEHPIVYASSSQGAAILSGGAELELNWRRYGGGIYQAVTPAGIEIDQLFVNGTNQRMARYPNYNASKKTDAYQGYDANAFSPRRARRWAKPAGAYIHAMHRSRWGGYHYVITGKSELGEVQYEGGWQNNRQSGMHKELRMVENILEELDAPGEWYHDAENQVLYYMPDFSESPTNATEQNSNSNRENFNVVDQLNAAHIEVVRLRHLVEFRGRESDPVRHITFKGFVVRHAARTFMETKEPLLRSDWAIYRGGAFLLEGTEDVTIVDTEFDQLGGNAIFASEYNRRILVKGCHIHDVGASGVCFVGDPGAVRDPLFEYGQTNDLTKIDRTPGPRNSNYPANCVVTDCLIHGVGRVERQPAGVQISMAKEITVSDVSIYDCARAGINIGDGCWGGHLIERCDVFDTVLETHDHGSFNSWGRDRFWHRDRSATQAVVDKEPDMPFLDAQQTTVIRNSRWRCDHGWDIDLDDGSSNYDIYNNLMLQGGLKLREGFRRRAWNNITVNNGFHPHVWYDHSQDEVFGNIFMRTHRGARMPSHTAKGKRVDGNLFFTTDPAMKDRFVEYGWDVNSIIADPQFADPASGDFRVRGGSPALKIGFKNFPMDQFGVKKPSLKRIAATPVIPDVEVLHADPPTGGGSRLLPTSKTFWFGAEVDSLLGEEYSAFGVSKESGGVKVSNVGLGSESARLGLRDGDLIQKINGMPVENVAALLRRSLSLGDGEVTVTVMRNQQAKTLRTHEIPVVVLESSSRAEGFKDLDLPKERDGKVTAYPKTRNFPVDVLTDGELQDSYGPVFGNGTFNGIYRMDLGESKLVSAISSWSVNHGSRRGPQKLTIYGSNASMDPGYRVSDRKKFTPLVSIDTTSMEPAKFNAVSLRSRSGKSLGTYRWIYWQVNPISKLQENTAFQELHVQSVAANDRSKD